MFVLLISTHVAVFGFFCGGEAQCLPPLLFYDDNTNNDDFTPKGFLAV